MYLYSCSIKHGSQCLVLFGWIARLNHYGIQAYGKIMIEGQNNEIVCLEMLYKIIYKPNADVDLITLLELHDGLAMSL
ncbi:unnamed protein product [Citrullus colocynthis]|uniref:Uncharacterized protein n=1 Tax=Citrullus colocynthis TaxID=252529 RepID=A0ABP0XRM6_9ROSI